MKNSFHQPLHEIIGYLKGLDSKLLPGFEAHLQMTPYRSKASLLHPPSDARFGAVAIIINQNLSCPEILLTKRADYTGTHGGQISFPGGKPDDKDRDLLHTAIRETFEETGILLREDNFLTSLTPIYIPPSNFIVHPFVFEIEEFEPLTPNHEVDIFIKLPVQHLMNKNAIEKTKLVLSSGKILNDAPCINFQNNIIWGATAAILNELRIILIKK